MIIYTDYNNRVTQSFENREYILEDSVEIPEIIERDGYIAYLCYEEDKGFYIDYENPSEYVVDYTPVYTEEDYKELVIKLIREKYSIDDELSLHRQRSDKFSEFYEYSCYCEECKKKVKDQLGLADNN